ncbi:MAG: solute carrier family 23 protein, partial [Bacilli bacterium]
MENSKLLIDIQEKPKSIGKWMILSFQHVFAMFGATVLVPLLTGLNVGVALVASGIGTLIYIVCTKGKVPVYLGSSFAYIAAIQVARGYDPVTNTFAMGPQSAFIGIMVVGIIYAIISTIIRFTGSGWLKKLLPPVVIGPMIIIIGLSLAPTAVSSAGLMAGGDWKSIVISVATFFAVVGFALLGKGFIKVVPFLLAILVGYVLSVVFGVVNLETVFSGREFFVLPEFQFLGTYKVDFSAVLMFAPLAFVTIAEHIGDHVVLGEITGRDFLVDPGLDKTILGDGIATFAAAAIGGPANTTYGENTGVVALTKVGSVWVTGLAAIFAILLGFFGWIQAFISSIPWAV